MERVICELYNIHICSHNFNLKWKQNLKRKTEVSN